MLWRTALDNNNASNYLALQDFGLFNYSFLAA